MYNSPPPQFCGPNFLRWNDSAAWCRQNIAVAPPLTKILTPLPNSTQLHPWTERQTICENIIRDLRMRMIILWRTDYYSVQLFCSLPKTRLRIMPYMGVKSEHWHLLQSPIDTLQDNIDSGACPTCKDLIKRSSLQKVLCTPSIHDIYSIFKTFGDQIQNLYPLYFGLVFIWNVTTQLHFFFIFCRDTHTCPIFFGGGGGYLLMNGGTCWRFFGRKVM